MEEPIVKQIFSTPMLSAKIDYDYEIPSSKTFEDDYNPNSPKGPNCIEIKEPDLEAEGISYEDDVISLDKIKPVQTDRVPGLAQKVAKNFHGKDKPFILDKNNYLVNGHHRYDAARLLGIDRVSVLKVDVPIELLMKKFSHTRSNAVVEDVDIDSLPDMGSNFPVQKQDIQNIQSVIDKKVPDIVPFDNKALVNTAKKKFPDATPGMKKNCEVISSMVAKKYGLQNPKPIIVMHEKRSGIGMCYHNYDGAGSYPQKGRGQISINWKANIIDRVVYDYFDEKGNRKKINVTGSMNGKDIHTLKANVYEQYIKITQSKKEEIISNWEYQEGLIDIGNGYQILSGENQKGYQDNDALLIDPNHNIVDNHTDIEKLLDNNFGIIQGEDVVDGNFPKQQRDREMQQGIERELKMYKILERLAQMWWNNDMSPAVEQKLADMGWEVGEDEGSDTPSVFVIEIGDENGNSYISWPIEQLEQDVVENFADGKKKGKSRPGRVKRSGASCNGSVTALRKRAKNSSGEKSKMYHWCANMKSGKKKSK